MIGTIETRSFTEGRTFSEIKRLSSAGLDGPELLRRAAERLKVAVPFEAYCASTVDPATNLITCGIAEGMDEGSGDEGDAFFDRVYFEEDLHQISSMIREGRSVALLSEETGGRLERSLRYRELLKPLGFAHELGSVFIDGSAWGGMDMIRAADDPDFNGREIALVRRVAPYISAGLKAATLRRAATVEPAAEDDVPGVLTLDRRGHVLSHTPSAERLLSELEELDPFWREGALPIAVRMVVSAVRRALAPRGGRDENLVPRVRVRARSGRWLTLHASLTESTHLGHPNETVVVIEPARPQEVAWLNAAAHGLTPAKKRWSGSWCGASPPGRSPAPSTSRSTPSRGTCKTPSRR